jgi:phosphatidylserine decarboxylase
LPKDQKVLEAWLAKRLLAAEKRMERDFHPVIQEFQQLIEGDAKIYMGFHQMFEQVPLKPPHFNNPTGKPQVGIV